MKSFDAIKVKLKKHENPERRSHNFYTESFCGDKQYCAQYKEKFIKRILNKPKTVK